MEKQGSSKRNIKHLGLEAYQVCSKDDPRVSFDFFMERSNLRPHTLCKHTYEENLWEKKCLKKLRHCDRNNKLK